MTSHSPSTGDAFFRQSDGLRASGLYPSYRSFDEFLDIGQLRGLDGFIEGHIREHIRDAARADYFVNEHRLDTSTPYVPGVREIWLTRTAPDVPYDYLDLDRPGLWHRTPEADRFEPLIDFVGSLPFESTGRILIIFDDSGAAVPAHRDHEREDVCNEFVWFRTNLRKPLYMLDHRTGEKLYVDGYSAWFDTVNQFHGSDAADGLNFSIRVDGKFTEDFRKQIPAVEGNAAAAAAAWARSIKG